MSESKRGGLDLRQVRRKAIAVAPENWVRAETLLPGENLPLVIQPAIREMSLHVWAADHRDFIEARLLRHGAIIFRGFGLEGADEFERFVRAVSSQVMEYRERSSPRSQVSGHIYTSTDYPADQSIFPHNEHSYTLTWPMKLYFYCQTPADSGGETPLADCRKVFARITPQTRERFIKKRWMLVRNYGDGFGLPWRTVFNMTERSEVEEYCRRSGIEVEWKDGDRLRTRQVREPAALHPRTGEWVWFNHLTFFHVTTLPPAIRDGLLAQFREEDLPTNTYYGDGSPIEPSVLEELRQAYLRELVAAPWQKGDIALIDNMLTSHARHPFHGPRKILFAMAEPFHRSDLKKIETQV